MQLPKAPMTESPEPQELAPPPARHPILRFFRQIGPAGPVALIATVLPAVGALVLFGFARQEVPWLRHHQPLSVIVFAIALAALGGFALVPTYANSLLGGFTFGFPIGFPAVMAGLGGAAMIGYALAHRIVGDRVSRVIHEHPKWELVRNALVGGSTRHVILIVTLLRLSPVLPFETTNVLLASCEVRAFPFLIGTLIGVLPRTAAIVFVASRVRRWEDLSSAGGRWMIVLGIVGTIIGAVIITIVSKHALKHATRPRD
jgi:uncharacterized membrane protein YdjX (TVP38/TMEM64 family)